ncbi:chorismate mutase [Neisseriaceae bacterium TC5R-5]|nr:chorismate mutase [Neisseriaceae bacterium TC5R-5]
MDSIYQCQNLDEVRQQIDRIDQALVSLIAERGLYVRQAAQFKHSHAEVEDGKRVDQVIRRVQRLAGELGADPQLTAAIYRQMIEYFIADEKAEYQQQMGR